MKHTTRQQRQTRRQVRETRRILAALDKLTQTQPKYIHSATILATAITKEAAK